MEKRYKKLGHTGEIAISFILIIMIGTILLSLPIATRDGSVNFFTSLFTATSSTCVTGLVVVDTCTHWSAFGQLVILSMIQIGGLGFLTIGVYVSVLLRKHIGLARREALHESVNTIQTAGVVRLAKKIIQGTIIFESLGALLLSIRFVPEYGWGKGIYYGVFHSISAFCNAGFDLFGIKTPFNSFADYVGDPLVTITIMCLIVIGGIGFIVWEDVSTKGFRFHKYLLHSKIVLAATAVLIFGSALLFWIFEHGYTLDGLNASEQILSSFFSSITARTAGFNTVDTASLSNSSKLLTMILMFIGGASGSTAGGIKITTFVVVIVSGVSMMRNRQAAEIFGRRLPSESIRKATTIILINLSLILISAFIIFSIQTFPFENVLFEVFSAIGTVGMSTGITRDLNVVSKVIIILLMYCGRVGSLSFAIAFTRRNKVTRVTSPKEKIVVG